MSHEPGNSAERQRADAPVPHDHIVQFFDGDEGLAAGAHALVLARPVSTHMIARAFAARGVSLQSLLESGRLTIVDAAATLMSFRLLCGYSAAHFAGDSGRSALRAICAQHGSVLQDQSDLLASWLLTSGQLA